MQEYLRKYLEDSLMLSHPLIASDPCYTQLNSSLDSILEFHVKKFGNFDSLTPLTENLLILYCKYEIFQRLATSVSPEFDVTAEQVSFKKGNRFFHYYDLMKITKEDIEKIKAEDKENSFDSIINSNVLVKKYNGTLSNYNFTSHQAFKVEVKNVGEDFIDIEFDKFSNKGSNGDFRRYKVFWGKETIYDDFTKDKIISEKVIDTYSTYDIHNTRVRIPNLERGTIYNICVEMQTASCLKSYSNIAVETVVL